MAEKVFIIFCCLIIGVLNIAAQEKRAVKLSGIISFDDEGTVKLPPGSCLHLSVQRDIQCESEERDNPVLVKRTIRNIEVADNELPYELDITDLDVDVYTVQAKVNVGKCLASDDSIANGDYHNDFAFSFDKDESSNEVQMDINVVKYVIEGGSQDVVPTTKQVKLTGYIQFGDKEIRVYRESCLHLTVQKNIACEQIPCYNPYLLTKTMKNLQTIDKKIAYELDVSALQADFYIVSAKLNYRCKDLEESIDYGDYHNDFSMEFEKDSEKDEIILDIDVVLYEKGCTMNGKSYKAGEAAYQECNRCNCGPSGHFACTLKGCFGGVCYHEGKAYQDGEKYNDGCNDCTCSVPSRDKVGQFGCTEMACIDDTVNKGSRDDVPKQVKLTGYLQFGDKEIRIYRESCLHLSVQKNRPCEQIPCDNPYLVTKTMKNLRTTDKKIAYELDVSALEADLYIVQAKLNYRCKDLEESINYGDYHNDFSVEFEKDSEKDEILLDIDVVLYEKGCTMNGKSYKSGEAAYQECNRCNCGPSGHFACTLKGCFGGVCYHEGKAYQDGEKYNDGCNDCTCSVPSRDKVGQFGCTEMACIDDTVNKAAVCTLNGKTYKTGEQAYDKCNLCTCGSTGNFGCSYKYCSPGVCYDEGKLYEDGEKYNDGCNDCVCAVANSEEYGIFGCTKKFCFDKKEERIVRLTPVKQRKLVGNIIIEGKDFDGSDIKFHDTSCVHLTVQKDIQCDEIPCENPYLVTKTMKNLQVKDSKIAYELDVSPLEEDEMYLVQARINRFRCAGIDRSIRYGDYQNVYSTTFGLNDDSSDIKLDVDVSLYEKGCVLKGKSYKAGEGAYDECNRCICSASGNFGCTLIGCGTGVCYHEGKAYNDGDNMNDGCNDCVCNVRDRNRVGDFSCTKRACIKNNECRLNGKTHQTGEQAYDKCNLCTCGSTGVFGCTYKGCSPGLCYHEGNAYKNGERYNDGCNDCLCSVPDKEKYGNFACTRKACITPKLTKCQALIKASNSRNVGAFVPTCHKETGHFTEQQCHGSTGYCWCVDKFNGVETEGTRTGPGQTRKECFQTKCQTARANTASNSRGLEGAFVPQCHTSTGDFQRQQCHGSSGYCWCVDKASGEEVEGTRTGPGQSQYDCSKTCEEGGKTYKLGDKYNPGGDLCTTCHCTSSGVPTCLAVSCRKPDCANPILKKGTCCDYYCAPPPLSSDCEKRCNRNYLPYCGSDGRTYPNECIFEIAQCKDKTLTSTPGKCESPPIPPKIVCKANGKEYSLGDKYNLGNDPCVTCHCEPTGPSCVAVSCKKPTCKDAVRKPGTCCEFTCPSCERACFAIYKPVCGSNKVTYPNSCAFGVAQCKDNTLKSFVNGRCEDIEKKCNKPCTKEFKPYCGSDGQTYGNKCVFEIAQCKDDKLTSRVGKCSNKCEKPCTRELFEMCGSDGVTYGNKCMFEIAQCKDKRLTLNYEGRCSVLCAKPCPKIYRPVCGSNGQTYSNECVFEIAKCNDESLTMTEGKCAVNVVCKANGKEYSLGDKYNLGNDPCITCYCEPNGQSCVAVSCKKPTCKDAVRKPGTCCDFTCPSCERACIAIYKPVCGSNKVTYPNSCAFSVAQCKDNTLKSFVNGRCEDIEKKCNKPCTKEFKPYCGSDGQTYGNKCVFEIAQCKDDKLTGRVGKCSQDVSPPGPNKCEKPCTRELFQMCGSDGVTYGNKCMFEIAQCKDKRLTLNYEGRCSVLCAKPCPKIYRPVCGSNGQTYSNKCIFEIAKCNDESLTMTEGKCATEVSRNECGDLPIVNCAKDPCAQKYCETYPRAVCKANYCGGCNAEYFLDDKKIDCPHTTCNKACTYEYDPQCGSNGRTYPNPCTFEIAQCQDDTLFLQNAGKCNDDKRVQPSNGPCFQDKQNTKFAIGSFRVKCTNDGYYESQQCHGSTGHCWCVDNKTGKEIDGTRMRPGEGVISCEAPPRPTKGRCHIAKTEFERRAANGPIIGGAAPDCQEDGSYKAKQCNPSTASCWCVNTNNGAMIPGTGKKTFIGHVECEAQSKGKCHSAKVEFEERAAANGRVIGGAAPDCKEDGSYKAKQCNPSTASCWCVDTNTGAMVPGSSKKTFEGQVECTTQPRGKCHSEKVEFERRAANGPVIGGSAPDCKEDGSYSPKQCNPSAASCWCVDTNTGAMIPGTAKQTFVGHVQCIDTVTAVKPVEKNCEQACPRYRRPVCASNGQSYGNKCLFKIAQCKNPSINVVKCKSEEARARACESRRCKYKVRYICGNDGVDYINGCKLRVAQCKNPLLKFAYKGKCRECKTGQKQDCSASDPCSTSICPAFPQAECRVNRCGSCTAEYTILGKKLDCGERCAYTCSKFSEEFKVCGTDGKTYKNPCELNYQRCLTNGRMQFKKRGECN